MLTPQVIQLSTYSNLNNYSDESWSDQESRQEIGMVLNAIDQAAATGRIVYVSFRFWTSIRGLMAGCYFARHGQSGAGALKILNTRHEIAFGCKRELRFAANRKLVRSWKAGD